MTDELRHPAPLSEQEICNPNFRKMLMHGGVSVKKLEALCDLALVALRSDKSAPENEPTWDELDAIVEKYRLDGKSLMDTARLIWNLTRSDKLCDDCGCESECIQLGCAKRYDEVRQTALEDAAKVAENWGNAPPNPHGRRAALAAEIRALAAQSAAQISEPLITDDREWATRTMQRGEEWCPPAAQIAAPQEPTQHTANPVSDSPTPAGAAPCVVDALGECIEELRDIRAWAVTENAPLRRQEVDSIDEVIEKANAALSAAPAAQQDKPKSGVTYGIK